MSALKLWTKIDVDGQLVVVSTIDRDCSALEGGRYAETMVFEYDGKKLGHILDQDEAPEGERGAHDRMVAKWTPTREKTEGVEHAD